MLQNTRRSIELVEPKEPQLYRSQFPYSKVPRVLFDNTIVPPKPAREIWITDTTFRDGQQARAPYTPDQIADIYTMLHRLGGPRGLIRQSEFFLYSERDRAAVEKCREKGVEFPEITGWIRANESDLELVRDLGLAETGILTSVSDYHIFLKLKLNRRKAFDQYLSIVRSAIEHGIRPRCHFEDVTRADIYGFCLPMAAALREIAEDSGTPVKIRLCDTMGYGVSFPGATLPRSVPKLINAFRTEVGYPSEWLEWHGHNDFHKVHANGATAWLYGVSALNASLLGFGERTGNPPLEAAVIEYISLTGDEEGINTQVITEIADYYRDVVHAEIPDNYPFVGAEFNTTRAGIHADGLLKNPEIYNIFDTNAILKRPLRVLVTDKSGLAGVARWINENVEAIVAGHSAPVSKRHPGVQNIYNWVDAQYAQGRTTAISAEELVAQAKHFIPSLFVSGFTAAKRAASQKARDIATRVSEAPAVRNLNAEEMEPYLHEVVRREGSIQLLAVTNTEGRRISQVHVQRGERGRFRSLMNKDFTDHDWFVSVIETGEPYFSDLFFSRFTGELIMTAALPLKDDAGRTYAVIDIDFKFDELTKLDTELPDELLDHQG